MMPYFISLLIPATTRKLNANKRQVNHATVSICHNGYSPTEKVRCTQIINTPVKAKANPHRRKSSVFKGLHYLLSHTSTFMFRELASIKKFYHKTEREVVLR